MVLIIDYHQILFWFYWILSTVVVAVRRFQTIGWCRECQRLLLTYLLITNLLNRLAPIQQVTCHRRKSDLWFDNECHKLKQHTSRLERQYLATRPYSLEFQHPTLRSYSVFKILWHALLLVNMATTVNPNPSKPSTGSQPSCELTSRSLPSLTNFFQPANHLTWPAQSLYMPLVAHSGLHDGLHGTPHSNFEGDLQCPMQMHQSLNLEVLWRRWGAATHLLWLLIIVSLRICYTEVLSSPSTPEQMYYIDSEVHKVQIRLLWPFR